MATGTEWTCVVVIDEKGNLCGLPANTTRVVEDLVCAMCTGHARQFDAEAQFEANDGIGESDLG